MPKRSQSWLGLVIGVICLTLAIAVSLFVATGAAETRRTPLAASLPIKIEGWEAKDLPLGDSEVTNASAKLLNYDDYVYRVYRRGAEEVFLYAMYWKQGSISVREIAGHTPDGCWIANGASMSASKATRVFLVSGQTTAPGEIRQFVFPHNQPVQVAWWHLWGHNLVDRDFDRKSIVPTLRELWIWLGRRHGRRQDQVLVRIHTTGDIDLAMKSEPVRVFLNAFPEVFSAKPL